MIQPGYASVEPLSVAAHYDELDPFYRAIWGTHLHHGYWQTGGENTQEAVLNLTRFIASEAHIESGSNVCDFGCGYGATGEFLAENYGARVTGITISRRQHEYATARLTRCASVQVLLADGLPDTLAKRSFDAFIAIESTEHIRDKINFLRQAHTLLRPDGRLAIAAWLACEQPGDLESRFLLEPICAEGRLPNLPNASEYLTMVEAAEFHDARFTDLTDKVAKTWRLCAFGFLKMICLDPSLRSRLFRLDRQHAIFARTVFRIWLAYRVGSMRYGVFSART